MRMIDVRLDVKNRFSPFEIQIYQASPAYSQPIMAYTFAAILLTKIGRITMPTRSESTKNLAR